MKYVKWIFSAFLALGVFSAQAAQPAADETEIYYDSSVFYENLAKAALQSSEMSICANTPIPSGWIVSFIATGCSGLGKYTIRQLDTSYLEMTMCAVQPIPVGWIVSAVQGTCQGIPQYVIRPVNPNFLEMQMCNVPSAQVPAGWVVKDIAQGCNLVGYGRWTISPANPGFIEMSVCAVAQLPPKWVVVSTVAGCYGAGRWTIRYVP
ncbi:hypothetical protein [Acidovorax sp. 1608163]|uniref:hypothetical protein n=1 Tax=Acidovorax sp. 1608163 TaxID=2478662 RepID=UPI0013CEFDEE|nr:hypothetical protein [Acidovorax sp. 1608163]